MSCSHLEEKSFLNRAGAERTAQRFRVLSEPMHVRILGELFEGGATSAGRLAETLRAPVKQVGEQLEVLQTEGLVAGRSDSRTTIYWLRDPEVLDAFRRVLRPFGKSSEGSRPLQIA